MSEKRLSSITSDFVIASLIQAWSAAMLCAFALVGVVTAAKNGASFLAAIIIFGSLVVYCHQRNNTSSGQSSFDKSLFAFLVTSIACTIAWAILFNSNQVSDFGVYFRCGTARHSTMQQWLSNCQSAYLDPNSTYWLRSFFYSAPVGALFPDSYDALKLLNAGLHIATVTVWAFGIRHYYGPRIALISSAIFCFYPEYWFTTTLATTDNAALLCIAIFILLLPKLGKSGLRGASTAVSLGITMFLSQQLRSTGAILVVALIAWAAATAKPLRRRVASMSALAFVTYYALNKIFFLAFPQTLPDLFNLQKILSAIDFHTTQDFSVNYIWAEHFWKSIPNDLKFDVAVSKVMLELSSGLPHWPAYILKKASVAFAGTGYYGLSSFPFPHGNPDSENVAIGNVPFIPAVFPWLRSLSTTLLIGAFLAMKNVRRSSLAFSATLLIGAFALIVIGFGEIQARYSLLIVPPLSLLFSLSLFPSDIRSVDTTGETNGFSFRQLLGGLLALGAIYAISVVGVAAFGQREGLEEHAELLTSQDCNNRGVDLTETYKTLTITMANGSYCANVRVHLPAESKALSFFVSGSRFPFRFEERSVSPFRYEVTDGETTLLRESLGKDSVHWRKVTFPKRAAQEVLIRIERLSADNEDHLDFTLLQATR